MPAAAYARSPGTKGVLFATGRRVGLGDLHPWYSERDHTDIADYADTALTELRAAAAAALGPDNPINHHPKGTTAP